MALRRGICAIQGCENKSKKEYWVEFQIEGEGDELIKLQINVCSECFQKIRSGEPYSI